MASRSARAATAWLQNELRTAGIRVNDKLIEADGKWGKFTEAAWTAAPAALRTQLERELTAQFQESPGTLRLAREGQQLWISKEETDAIISRAVVRVGVEKYENDLKGFLDREAVKRTLSGVKQYLVTSRNGRSLGLMQMQPAAWSDSQRVVPEIGPYSNVFDAELNILAGVAYAMINISRIRNFTVINADTLYLAHNQGSGFFSKGIVTAYDKQSKEARELIDRYRVKT